MIQTETLVSLFLRNIFEVQNKCIYLQRCKLAHSWAAGSLIYKKDVFERLSLCTTNLANSKPQQTDDNRDVYVVRIIDTLVYYMRTGVG